MSQGVKQVCTCENCGNEAEMVVTCTLVPEDAQAEKTPAPVAPAKKKEKRSIHCTHCGNEAEMWVDLDES